ncbi:reverse transcriptase domain-containing protein [Tanacetum coccineum]
MRTRSQSREQRPPPPEGPPVVIEPLRIEYPFQEDPTVEPMADTRTMAQLLQAPTEGYEDAILIPEIVANNFELKHGLINLVQNKQFFGHDKEDPHAHIRYFNKITSTMRVPNVPIATIKLMLFPFSIEGAARIWLEKEPPRSIQTWDDLVSKFINQFFPPSKTTNLRNEITRFQQRFDESFYEAWDRFNDLLRACPHHGFSELHQLDTFYNALNINDQDSLNSAAGGNFLDKMPRECLKIIESKSKVRQTRAKAVVAKVSTNSSTQAVSSDVAELKDIVRALLLDKKNQASAPAPAPAPVKAVELSCVTCGGAHSHQNCPATHGNVYRDNISEYVSQAAAANYNQVSSNFRPQMVANHIRPPGFPPVQNSQANNANNFNRGNNFNQNRESNFNQNRGGNFNQSNFSQNQLHRPQVNQSPAYQAPVPQTHSVTKNDFDNYVKANDAIMRNMQNNLQNQGMDDCLALADLGASINLMPISVWVCKLSLPDLTPIAMTLETCGSIFLKPIKDISVKVGVFHFPADFVVVDFEPDPRVPLILGRCFLKTGRALIDVHKGELTLRIGSEAITYNLDQTSRYSANYTHMTANKIDVIDMAYDPDCPAYNPFYYDPEGDILILEAILNSEPPLPPPSQGTNPTYLPEVQTELKVCETNTANSSVDEPTEVELKELPPHLESHKRALGLENFADISGITRTRNFTHKILMEEDYAPWSKHQRSPWVAEKPRSDHLSRLENPYENVNDPKEINESFPLETLNMVTFRGDSRTPWFADFANYHAGDVCTAMKLLRFSQLATMDPPGASWCKLQPKRSVKLRCLKTPSKFVKTLHVGHRTLWARSRSARGNKYILVAVAICQNGLKQKAIPPMMPECLQNSEISLRQFGAPVQFIVIADTHSVMDSLQGSCRKYLELSPSLHLVTTNMWAVEVQIVWLEKNLERTIGENRAPGSGYQQKDRKPSQNDKTEHGMEKTVQNQGQSPKMSKSESILKNQQSKRSRN